MHWWMISVLFYFLQVEVQAYPLMVDCRPGAGAPPHELPHPAPNGAPPDNHHNQVCRGLIVIIYLFYNELSPAM